jgi:cystathionine beta-lyase/cystathionine gamma-synthase
MKYSTTSAYSSSFVDTSDLDAVESAVTPQTKIIFIETPGNPTLKLTDIAGVSAIAKRHGCLLAVDNTFLTPVLQRPLELGAHISVLSTTKYIDGHNATVGGSLATHDESVAGALSPRSARPLALSRRRLTHGSLYRASRLFLCGCACSARTPRRCAQWLEAHPAVARVYYPGLDSFPQRALAGRQQQRAFGAMLSFELNAPYETAIKLLNSIKLCTRAESLGGLETLMTHPPSTTHADLDPDYRRGIGISDGFIRISVGLESPDDIIADHRTCVRSRRNAAHEPRRSL